MTYEGGRLTEKSNLNHITELAKHELGKPYLSAGIDSFYFLNFFKKGREIFRLFKYKSFRRG